MGQMIQPTPEYGAEVRKESFYITTCRPLSHPIFVYGGSPVRADGVVEFLLADIPKLRQVLDAVEAEVNGQVPLPVDEGMPKGMTPFEEKLFKAITRNDTQAIEEICDEQPITAGGIPMRHALRSLAGFWQEHAKQK